jgi:hypothetical protein
MSAKTYIREMNRRQAGRLEAIRTQAILRQIESAEKEIEMYRRIREVAETFGNAYEGERADRMVWEVAETIEELHAELLTLGHLRALGA